MGLSSSLLDENKVTFIKGWVQTELRNFASVYKKQYSLAFLSHVHDELVQRKQENTQLLTQPVPLQESEVIYQESVLCFYDNKKWKERLLVVRANYSLECHESFETFTKGILPLDRLPTTGGTILTTEEKYIEMVDRCFPDTDIVKEDFAPPVMGMPGQYPVYLRLPYCRDQYFCFLQEAKQAMFISVLSDCIRHQNQDFLKKTTYEVQAFIKAVQLYRQEKGYYEPWDMLIGNDVQVLTNLIMEELWPSLEKDLLPRLKTKKVEKKKIWFATIEAAYSLVQENVMEGMAALNEECRETTKQQSALMRSDMDQIMSSRTFLESKLRAKVAELANEYCKLHIKPHLCALLEEMMGPISLGFEEARHVSESMMENLCQYYQDGMTEETLQQALVKISKPNLQSCYEKVSGLKDLIQEVSYPNCRGLEHSTHIDIQQLVDSVAHTFGLLLSKSQQDTSLLDAMVKAKQRVLKQYDYDSSTQRKKIFQEALLSIMLPNVKAFLAPTFKKELLNFEQYIFDDYVNFINVENVYEDILQQILEDEVSKVVKEAASMKKYNLFEFRYRLSTSGKYITPPSSPQTTISLTQTHHVLPSSLLLSHGITESQHTGEDVIMAEKMEMDQEVFVAQQEEVHTHEQADLIKVTTGEHQVMIEKEEPDIIVSQKPEEQNVANKVLAMLANVATETRARSTKLGTLTVHAAIVEETLDATQSLEEKMSSGPPDVVAINTETLFNPSSSSNTEPALKPAAQTLFEHIPKQVETESYDAPVIYSSPAAGTEPVTQMSQGEPSSLKCVTAKSKTETVASISPGDTKGEVNDFTSLKAPIYETRVNKMTEDFSDDSSWTTEEEGDSIVDDDLTMETTTAIPKHEHSVIVKCETVSDVTSNSADRNTEGTRPLDCIKEIRDLVVEVIEVEEVAQHDSDNGEVII